MRWVYHVFKTIYQGYLEILKAYSLKTVDNTITDYKEMGKF